MDKFKIIFWPVKINDVKKSHKITKNTLTINLFVIIITLFKSIQEIVYERSD